MRRLRFVGILIQPSLSSLVLCLTASALLLVVSSISYNAQSGFLYDFIFGPDSSVDLIESGRSTFDAIYQTAFGNPLLNKIVFFAFWCLVGLVVYFLLTGAGKTTSVISDTAHQLHYFNARKKQFEQELGLRLIIASIAVLFGLIYSVFFIRTLLPFSVLCGRIGVGSLNTLSGWLYTMAGFAVLALSLHIFIVTLRLLLMRPRLYGGGDDVIENEMANEQHGI